jgi:hypothetical protein
MATKQYFPVKRFMMVALVAVGLVTALYAAGIQTQTKQHASEDVDINTSFSIGQTANPDGTMGPDTWHANFSNSLPANALGKLEVNVAKPASPGAGKETPGNKGKNGKGNENGNGKPADAGTLTSLLLTVTKIEVHLANLCGSGNLTSYPNPSGRLVPSPNNRKPLDKLTGADKWETLELNEGNQTIDLVNLTESDVAERLGLANLACGKYTEIRLYISSATASYNNGPEIVLTIPGRANIVRIVRPFEINAGGTTSLSIEFNPEKSVMKSGGMYLLKPVVARMITK